MKIQIKHLSHRFGKKVVLNQINLKFEKPGIFGLFGRNGAGKSTIMNLIADRTLIQDGEITLDGKVIHNNSKALSHVYLMNDDALYPSGMNVKQVFQLSADFYGDFDHERAKRMSQEFNLDLNKKMRGLSTGHVQIVKIIVGLCIPVDFILMDEPVSGLDANNRSLFYSELIQAYIDRPRCFVISTHLIDEIEHILNDVVIIDDHNVIVDDTIDQVELWSHQISGPQKEVDQYVDGLNVIGEDQFGNITNKYIYGPLDDDRILPDTVSIHPLKIQDLFIRLTSQGALDQ